MPMGKDDFHKKVTYPLQEVYVFGKVENHKYRFTGVDIKETSEGIEVNQKTYCDSLQEIKIENGKNNDRPLTYYLRMLDGRAFLVHGIIVMRSCGSGVSYCSVV